MLTNKNCVATAPVCILALVLTAVLSACAPSGERVLLQGKKLTDEGRFSEAVPKLEQATARMPKYAAAWNYLGLAYQGSGQPDQAVRAYRTALSLDHRLAAARYNLGGVLLDQGNLPAAIDELKSYTLLQPSALHGWLKLGGAQLKARRLDDAERSYRAALDLQARHPEALNGMGLIQSQRRRWQDALNYFNAAASQDPPYPPAVLNSAVTSHQNFGARAVALKRYRQYLDLQPRPADAAAVEALVRQMEGDIAGTPRPTKPATTNVAATSLVKTSQAPGVAQTAKSSNLPAGLTPRTNVVTSASPKPLPRIPVAVTNPSTATPPAFAESKPAPAPVVVAEPKPAPPPQRLPEAEVSKVQDALVVTPAQEPAAPPAAPSPATNLGSATVAAIPDPVAPKGTNAPKRSFLSRLNPFSGRSKTSAEPATTKVESPAPVASAPSSATPRAITAPAGDETANVPRYTYLSPAKPTPGNRTEADAPFRRGVNAQQRGDRLQAIADYQAALRSDPAFFNAYYNLGLAALDTGNVGLALAAYETALVLNPESTDARYNFALSLKAAGFYQDAAEQLGKIVAAAPDDARAHLALANLNAQQLRRSAPAREHYLKVLELNPRHPEASKIRYWLAANP